MLPPLEERFAALVDAVQLQSLHLGSSSMARHEIPVVNGSLAAAVSLESSGELRRDDERTWLICSVAFSFTGTSGDETLAEMSGTYVLHYTLNGEPPDEEAIQVFAENNATFNAWPFIRQYLHDSSVRLALPPFLLPLLHPDRGGERQAARRD
jgi:hypothetical protein